MSAFVPLAPPGREQRRTANDASRKAALESDLQHGFSFFLEAELDALKIRLSLAYANALQGKWPLDASAPARAAPVEPPTPRELMASRTERDSGNSVTFGLEEQTVFFGAHETEISQSTDSGSPAEKESFESSWIEDRLDPMEESLQASALAFMSDAPLPSDFGVLRRVVDIEARGEKPLAIEDRKDDRPRRVASTDSALSRRKSLAPPDAAVERTRSRSAEALPTQVRAALRSRRSGTQDTDPGKVSRRRSDLTEHSGSGEYSEEALNRRIVSRMMRRGSQTTEFAPRAIADMDTNTRRWCLLMRALMRYTSSYRLRECWADEARTSSLAWQTESSMLGTRQQEKEVWQEGSREGFSDASQEWDEMSEEPGNAVFQVWLEKSGRAKLHTWSLRPSERLGSQVFEVGSVRIRLPVFHPTSYKRGAWMIIGFLLLGSDMFQTTLTLFRAPDDKADDYIEIVACVYWSIDIVFSFFTGMFIGGEYVQDLRSIARKYARTWLVFDLALAVSQWVILAIGNTVAGSRAFAALRIARYMRLLRCAKFGNLWTELLQGVNSLLVATVAQASAYFLAIALWVHLSACAFYLIGSQNNGWVTRVEDWAYFPLNYCIALHWSAGQFQGGMDIYPTFTSAAERGFAAGHVLMCVVVLAIFVSKLTNIWQHLDQFQQHFNRLDRNARQYLDEHSISMELSGRVHKYVAWKQKSDSVHQSDMSEFELMQMLPVNLRRAVLDEARTPVICHHLVFPALQMVNTSFYQRMCCEAFSSVSHLPGENVFFYGTACQHMYFVMSGTSTYVKYGIVLRAMTSPAKKHKGNCQLAEQFKKQRSQQLPKRTPLCEAALWTQWEHVGDFSPVTHVSLLELDIDCFVDMVQTCPAVQSGLAPHAREFVNMLENDEVSDLFTSADMFENIAEAERQELMRKLEEAHISATTARQNSGEARVSTRTSRQGSAMSIFARLNSRQYSGMMI